MAFSHLNIEESSTITAKVASITLTRNSSVMHQEIISLGDPDTTNAVAAVLAGSPASTAWGLITREAEQVRVRNSTATDLLARVNQGIGNSSAADIWFMRPVFSSTVADNQVTATPAAGSTWATRPLQSSAADLQMTATPLAGSTWNVRPLQSSAADLQVTATPLAGSTWNVRPLQSSQGDLRVTVYQSTAAELLATVTPTAGSTWNVRPLQSSAADLQVTATPLAGSTWNVRPLQSSASDLKVSAYLFDSTGNAIDTSTQSMSSGARGLFVRSVIPGSTTYAASTAGNASMTSILTSNAATRGYVYGYSITSTLAGPVQWGIYSNSGATLLWTGILAAVSSAISGANLAVTPPGYLFRGSTGANLTFNCATSNAGLFVSIAMFRSS